MITHHTFHFQDSRDLSDIQDASVQLVVTSPPYPMIEMWDEAFTGMEASIGEALRRGDSRTAFEKMHCQLDRVWKECYRVLTSGGWACINIGDATRKLGGEFQLFPNHVRIVTAIRDLGFTVLPDILWHKPTNGPTKFMGSGMLPAGAYVTYEHEYVLVFRKGSVRDFREASAKRNRRLSAYFHEERNLWFSDLWQDIPGLGQTLSDPENRDRSAAFPFEIPYRLIQMYSVYGDTVLDPFLGTGTTSLAAAASGRNSIGVEVDEALSPIIESTLSSAVAVGQERTGERLRSHLAFVAKREAKGKRPKHRNRHYGFPIVSDQETDLVLYRPSRVRDVSLDAFEVDHVPAELPVDPVAPALEEEVLR